MRSPFKPSLVLSGVAVTSLVVAALGTSGCGPKAGPPPTRKVSQDPQLVARGKYLAENVAACVACHSKRDFSKVGAPIIAGTEGSGGEMLTKAKHNVPGTIPTPNITPTALSSWTDGEILHATTSGISKDGTALFPVMPYPNWRTLATEDADAIVAYVRSLPPLPGVKKERSLNFPLGIIVNTIPKPAEPQAKPDPTDAVATGKYLTTIAGCFHCHTIEKRGVYKEGMHFAGNHPFRRDDFQIMAPNITPDVETGIGSWTQDIFVARFAAYRDEAVINTARPANTPEYSEMAWGVFAGMTDEDLGAIFAYLRTVPAVKNPVVRLEKIAE